MLLLAETALAVPWAGLPLNQPAAPSRGGSGCGAPVESSHILFYYPLDAVSGATSPDVSGNGNTLNLTGSPAVVAGKVTNAMSFNGGGQYAESANPVTTGNSFSIACWVYPTEATETAYARIAETTYVNGLFLGFEGTGTKFCFSWNDGGLTLVSGAITANTWYHIVATVNSSGVGTLYVNGSSQGTLGFTAGSTTGPLYIATYSMSPNSYSFQGYIDNVIGWSAVLSGTEVTAEYNAGLAGCP